MHQGSGRLLPSSQPGKYLSPWGRINLELTNPPSFCSGMKCASKQEPRIAMNQEMTYAYMLRKSQDDFSWFSWEHIKTVSDLAKKNSFQQLEQRNSLRKVNVKWSGFGLRIYYDKLYLNRRGRRSTKLDLNFNNLFWFPKCINLF